MDWMNPSRGPRLLILFVDSFQNLIPNKGFPLECLLKQLLQTILYYIEFFQAHNEMNC